MDGLRLTAAAAAAAVLSAGAAFAEEMQQLPTFAIDDTPVTVLPDGISSTIIPDAQAHDYGSLPVFSVANDSHISLITTAEGVQVNLNWEKACGIKERLAVNDAAITARLDEIERMKNQAHNAVVAEGYPDGKALNTLAYQYAEQRSEEEGRDIGYSNQDLSHAIARYADENPALDNYEAKIDLYRAAVDEWLTTHHSTVSSELANEVRELKNSGGFRVEATQIAEAGCDAEINGVDNAGAATRRAIGRITLTR